MGLFDLGFGSRKKKRKGVTPNRAMQIAKSQDFSCAHCSKSITKRYQFHIDHIDGDRNNRDITNLQALCVECHSKKSHRQTKDRTKKAQKEQDPFGLNNLDLGFGSKNKTRKPKVLDDPLGFGSSNSKPSALYDPLGFGTERKSKSRKKKKKSDDPLDFGNIGF